MPPDDRSQPTPFGEHIPGLVLGTQEQLMKAAEERLLKDAPRVTRLVAKRIPGAPGLLYDATQVATAKDKWRAGVGIAGSVGGGALGGLVGGPVGSVIGSAIGDELATEAYDHRDDIRRGLEATKQWIQDRNAQFVGR